MMGAFLEELAEEIIKEYGTEHLDELTIIFPNTRAGIFFKAVLSKKIDQAIWAPEILGVDDFIKSLSKLQVPHKLKLIFELYKTYTEVFKTQEAFSQFYFWAEVILKDFEDIDKYEVSADRIFENIEDFAKIDQNFEYLSEEEKTLVSSFWKNFDGTLSKHQKDFVSTWELLPKVYHAFKEKLQKDGLAYTAMLHQDVIRNLDENQELKKYGKIIFAGFNALTRTEERIIKRFIEKGNAKIYWDADQYYFQDKKQEAGSFLREYSQDEIFSKSFPKKFKDRFSATSPKKIEVTGVALEVGQTKLLGEQLMKLKQEKEAKGEYLEDEKIAIVIPNEELLFPVLHSIPDCFKRLNVTMGYPIQGTSIFSLMEAIFDLQLKKVKNSKDFPYRQVLQVLKHPYLMQYDSELCQTCISEIIEKNMILVSSDYILKEDDSLLNAIFQPIDKVDLLFSYLKDLLILLHEKNFREKEAKTENEESEENEEKRESINSDKEFIYHLYLEINKFSELTLDLNKDLLLDLDITVQLLRQVIRGIKVPFTGEVLKGIQIMGVLETRNLDFDHVFLLSMNEKAFPAAPNNQSFIPYTLRKAFGLPTFEQHDAMYSYLFYRFLQKPSSINFYYNTETGGNISGEMSRFLLQLLHEYPMYSGIDIALNTLSNPSKLNTDQEIRIQKNTEIREKLSLFYAEKPKHLTASALNTYMDCGLKFFFRYVMGMKIEAKIEDNIDAGMFGNLFHEVMESLYKNLKVRKNSKSVEKSDFESLKKALPKTIEESFKKKFEREDTVKQEDFKFQGRNIIAKNILENMCLKVLEKDFALAPFSILGLELSIKGGISKEYKINVIGRTRKVAIKGIIDRVDEKDGIIRILDYKTGKDNKTINKDGVSTLFGDKKNKAAFQTILYSDIYNSKLSGGLQPICPVIYNNKDLYNKKSNDALRIGSETILDIRRFLPEFNESLKNLLEEIFNPDLDFCQTEDTMLCTYCEFTSICHRD